ncbi:unnamed protein product, partial [Prorocentrum cordatum]
RKYRRIYHPAVYERSGHALAVSDLRVAHVFLRTAAPVVDVEAVQQPTPSAQQRPGALRDLLPRGLRRADASPGLLPQGVPVPLHLRARHWSHLLHPADGPRHGRDHRGDGAPEAPGEADQAPGACFPLLFLLRLPPGMAPDVGLPRSAAVLLARGVCQPGLPQAVQLRVHRLPGHRGGELRVRAQRRLRGAAGRHRLRGRRARHGGGLGCWRRAREQPLRVAPLDADDAVHGVVRPGLPRGPRSGAPEHHAGSSGGHVRHRRAAGGHLRQLLLAVQGLLVGAAAGRGGRRQRHGILGDGTARRDWRGQFHGWLRARRLQDARLGGAVRERRLRGDGVGQRRNHGADLLAAEWHPGPQGSLVAPGADRELSGGRARVRGMVSSDCGP